MRRPEPQQIEIDGGVTNQNAKKLIESGAHVLVAGSFVFPLKTQRNYSRFKKHTLKKGLSIPF